MLSAGANREDCNRRQVFNPETKECVDRKGNAELVKREKRYYAENRQRMDEEFERRIRRINQEKRQQKKVEQNRRNEEILRQRREAEQRWQRQKEERAEAEQEYRKRRAKAEEALRAKAQREDRIREIAREKARRAAAIQQARERQELLRRARERKMEGMRARDRIKAEEDEARARIRAEEEEARARIRAEEEEARERLRAEKEARRRQEEEEEEEARRRQEEEDRRVKEEEEEEARRRQEEEDRRVKEEEEEEARRRQEEEDRRVKEEEEEEARRRDRKEEEEEEARRRQEEEDRRVKEEEEEEARRQEEEARRQEEEAQRREEEIRRREENLKRLEEEARLRQEQEDRRIKEEEARREEEERQRQRAARRLYLEQRDKIAKIRYEAAQDILRLKRIEEEKVRVYEDLVRKQKLEKENARRAKEEQDRLAAAVEEEKRREKERKKREAEEAQARALEARNKLRLFERQPGEEGFNAEASHKFREWIEETGKEFDIKCPEAGEERSAMAYQRVVEFLVHPTSPVDRLLCVWRTGSGKTYAMILALENYFDDPRAKVLVFPKASVALNFYSEVLAFPSKLQRFVLSKLTREEARLVMDMDKPGFPKSRRKAADDARAKVANLLGLSGRLHKRGKKGWPGGPMRAITYTTGSSKTVMGGKDPLFKIGFDGKNAYSNKVIIMDEVHNLVNPSPELAKYRSKITALAKAVKSCENSVVLGMTATPIVDKASDGDLLKSIIKGSRGGNDEGFVSFFNMLPNTIFPQVIPPLIEGPEVIRVPLEGENLQKYKKMDKGKPTPASDFKLQAYLNAEMQYHHMVPPARKNFITSLLGGAKLDKLDVSRMRKYATKLVAIADSIAKEKVKTLILVRKTHGLRVLADLLDRLVAERCGRRDERCWVALLEKPTARNGLQAKLDRFNAADNERGEHMRAIVAETAEYSEGVSFKQVRRLIMVNPPATWAAYKQQVGRALRSCAYRNLEEAERNVKIEMYVGTADGMETADERIFARMNEQREQLENAMMEKFALPAVDRMILERFAPPPPPAPTSREESDQEEPDQDEEKDEDQDEEKDDSDSEEGGQEFSTPRSSDPEQEDEKKHSEVLIFLASGVELPVLTPPPVQVMGVTIDDRFIPWRWGNQNRDQFELDLRNWDLLPNAGMTYLLYSLEPTRVIKVGEVMYMGDNRFEVTSWTNAANGANNVLVASTRQEDFELQGGGGDVVESSAPYLTLRDVASSRFWSFQKKELAKAIFSSSGSDWVAMKGGLRVNTRDLFAVLNSGVPTDLEVFVGDEPIRLN